jgi:hypothetical protein
LPEIATKIGNDKELLTQMVNTLGGNKREVKLFKREAKPLKRSREKKVDKKIAFQILPVR